MVKRVGDYLQEKTLGEGTFGKVKSAINTKTHEKVAMKIISLEKIQRHKMQTQITREISIMKSLKHKHVVELKDVLQSKNNIYMIMELCTGGELFDKIASFAPPPAHSHFDEELARKYFQQLIAGVRYCHSKGVAHRDLKPENLLLDEEGNLKISDFGLSASLQGREVLSTACGTPNYVAPEVIMQRGYDGRMADIWSCGVVLYVMLAGYLPFEEQTESVLYEKIKRAQHRGYPPWFSASVRAFLDKILVPDPHKRLTIEQMEKDPWFAVGYHPEQLEAASEPSPDETAIGQVGDEIAEQKPAGAPDITTSGLDVFTLISMLDTLSINPMLEHRGTGSVKRRTCFITAGDAAKTYAAALAVLGEQRILVSGHNQESMKILADTPRVRFGIQIYTLTPTNTLVEILRRRGDVLDFVRIYQAVSDAITKKCKA